MALEETGRGDHTPGEHHVQKTLSAPGEKTAVQKRTYTRWMNVFLKRCDPAVEVQDLYLDVRDGRALMALLEELSGCKLVYRFRPSTHRIFRLNNIAKALAFLDDRHVKLFGIDASGVADGVPHVILQLVWSIISFFQVKEATGGLQKRLSSSLSSLSTTSSASPRDLSPSPGDSDSHSSCTLPSKRRRPARGPRFRSKPMKTLLLWVQRRTSSVGVEVRDFGKSWRSGLAFLALIKSIDPGLVDLRDSLSREPQLNLEEAFRIAQDSLGIPALVEPQDVACTSPDERSVVTYLSMFLKYHSDADEDLAPDIGLTPKVPEIHDYMPAEPGALGETFAPQPEAEAFLHTQGETSEQLLWKRWSRRSPAEARPSRHPPRRKSSSRRATGDGLSPQPDERAAPQHSPSPPRAGDASDREDALAWMEEASEDHHVLRSSHVDLCVDRADFSQSLEDGLHLLSVLDSDEEDAYSYILDLHREHQRSDPAAANRRPVPEPPEGTTERRRKTSKRRLKGEPKAPAPTEGRMHRRKLPDPEDNGPVEMVGARPEMRDERGGERQVHVRVVTSAQNGGRDEARRENGGETRKEEPRVTGSEVLLEAVEGDAEEDEGQRSKRRAERCAVNAAERPASDSVFREGSVWVREEVPVFRGRFGDGVTSSTAAERSPGRVSDGGGISEDAGLVKHGDRQTEAGVGERAKDERKAKATVEKRVGIILSGRKTETTGTRPDVDGGLRRARGVEGFSILKPSSYNGEILEACKNQAVRDANKRVASESSENIPPTNTQTPIPGGSDEETHPRRASGDAEGERCDHERMNARVSHVMGGPPERRAREDTMQPLHTPVCRDSSLPVFREKGAAASCCDVTGRELEVLFGLWMLLFCYFLFPQIHH